MGTPAEAEMGPGVAHDVGALLHGRLLHQHLPEEAVLRLAVVLHPLNPELYASPVIKRFPPPSCPLSSGGRNVKPGAHMSKNKYGIRGDLLVLSDPLARAKVTHLGNVSCISFPDSSIIVMLSLSTRYVACR